MKTHIQFQPQHHAVALNTPQQAIPLTMSNEEAQGNPPPAAEAEEAVAEEESTAVFQPLVRFDLVVRSCHSLFVSIVSDLLEYLTND